MSARVSKVQIPTRPPLYSVNPQQTPYISNLKDINKNSDNFHCPTNVQHFNLKNKYLYKRKNTYYFSKRINNKPFKISLHSDNLDYCKILRDKIIIKLWDNKKMHIDNERQLRTELNKMILNNTRFDIIESHIKNEFDSDWDHTDNKSTNLMNSLTKEYYEKSLTDEQKRIRELENETNYAASMKELENNLLEKLSNNIQPVKKIKTEETQTKTNNIYENIEEYYGEYIEHRKTFDKVSNSSIKGYNASFRYLKYFINQDTEFNLKFFKDIQMKFTQLPKNFFKYSKYHTKTFKELMELKKMRNMKH